MWVPKSGGQHSCPCEFELQHTADCCTHPPTHTSLCVRVCCVCFALQYDQNLAGPALDYVGGDAARLNDPLVSPLLAEYGSEHPFPPTLIQVRCCCWLLVTALAAKRLRVFVRAALRSRRGVLLLTGSC